VAKPEHEESKKKKQKDMVNELVDGPDHCIHCDEDPFVSSSRLNRVCVRTMRDTLTMTTTANILWHTTVEDINVRTITQHSFYGKASTIGILTTGASKMEFGRFFLPSRERPGVTKHVKLVLSDCNSVIE
jgi:hypothetical protein